MILYIKKVWNISLGYGIRISWPHHLWLNIFIETEQKLEKSSDVKSIYNENIWWGKKIEKTKCDNLLSAVSSDWKLRIWEYEGKDKRTKTEKEGEPGSFGFSHLLWIRLAFGSKIKVSCSHCKVPSSIAPISLVYIELDTWKWVMLGVSLFIYFIFKGNHWRKYVKRSVDGITIVYCAPSSAPHVVLKVHHFCVGLHAHSLREG